MAKRSVSFEQFTERWILGNEQIQCEIWLEAGRLWWRVLAVGSGGIAIAPSEAPGLLIGHQQPRWIQVVDAQDRRHDDGSREVQIRLANEAGEVQLVRSFQLFPQQPFVRFWGRLENQTAAPLHIHGCEILRLTAPAETPLTLFHVEQFSWSYRRNFFSQNQVSLTPGLVPLEIRMGSFPSHFSAPTSCAWAALRAGPPDRGEAAPNRGDGLLFGIEFNGKSRLCAGATASTVELASSIDALNHLLAPGAAFEVPACFVGLFQGDWDEAAYTTHRFAGAFIHPPLPDERFPWAQYNSWGYGQELDEAQQLAAVERCAQIGVEAVVMDLGWAVQIGEWRANPQKFPRGLALLAQRAHELGLKFGVHMALAQAALSSPVAREHPDWLIHQGDDYFGGAPLCLGHEPCRQWLIGEIVRLIDEVQLDYILQDGEDMVKRCPHSHHTHTPGDSNYANAAGLDTVIESVRQLRPHIVWENCEDGGCMLTFKMARLYHTSITVDNIATYATRQGVYGASYPFPPRYSSRYMQDAPTAYTLRSAIFGGPLILMQRVTEWDETQLAETKAAIDQYKEVRSLLQKAKVIHLLAPRYNVEGVGWGWDAIQAVSHDQGQSIILVYRAQGGSDRRTIHPRGLLPDAHYQVHQVDSGERYEKTGCQLMAEGLDLALPELSSDMIRIERR
jgi:alpha-galactosidase